MGKSRNLAYCQGVVESYMTIKRIDLKYNGVAFLLQNIWEGGEEIRTKEYDSLFLQTS
jgi:hypothetical protein